MAYSKIVLHEPHASFEVLCDRNLSFVATRDGMCANW
jgi:hypothetical protein